MSSGWPRKSQFAYLWFVAVVASALCARGDETAATAIDLEKALDRRVDFDLSDVPLKDLPALLRPLLHVDVVLDLRALEDAGVTLDTPISFKVSGVTARSGLRQLLACVDLIFKPSEIRLLISTGEMRDDDQINRQVYDVRDLIGTSNAFGDGALDGAPLAALITNFITPQAWANAGGPGSLSFFQGQLVIAHNAEVQRAVGQLLRALRKVRAQAGADTKPVWLDSQAQEARERIAGLLRQKVSLHVKNVSLQEAIAQLRDRYKLPLLLNRGLPADQTGHPVSVDLDEAPLPKVLQTMLASNDLKARKVDDFLVVDDPANEPGSPITCLYPVADLVTADDADKADRGVELTYCIRANVAPALWLETGGPGHLEFFSPCNALICEQSPEVHDEIQQLLALLRANRPPVGDAASPTAEQHADEAETISSRIYALRVNKDRVFAVDVARAVKEVVEPASWKVPGAYAVGVGDKLLIRNTASVHRKVAQLLAELDFQPAGEGRKDPAGGLFSLPGR